ncbi:hypothetical protein GCM10010869_44050 [Mesorhizobium tianshanense]|nr:hypothetical protein GCM10010869_44050 [Mesorhizobium tianshanense]
MRAQHYANVGRSITNYLWRGNDFVWTACVRRTEMAAAVTVRPAPHGISRETELGQIEGGVAPLCFL